jgi:hypothetical protein
MDLEFVTKTIISLFALPIEQVITFFVFVFVLLVGTFIFAKKYGQANNVQHHKTDAQCDLYKTEMEKTGFPYPGLQISFHGDKPIFISCPYCSKKKCSINNQRCKFL